MGQRVDVTDPGHPLLADFVALGDPVTRRRVERAGGYFVVEGVLAIERLVALPHWRVRSFALLPKVAERLGGRLAAVDAPIAVADESVLRDVVGFDIHRGALASVDRVAPRPAIELVGAGSLLLAAEGVNDHENLGALYRNAAAFGVGAVLLDATSADPFYRRSVRVSLGNVLAVPTGHLGPLPAGLDDLHERGVTTVALTPAGDRDLRDLDAAGCGPGPVAVLVGAEGPGLSAATLAAATHRVRIPMATGVDSLNVATAAALALHHLAV
jgi:tRNA G18 (ribose-2'-O)-methylase SpoU